MNREAVQRLGRAQSVELQRRNHSRHSGSARTAFLLVLCLLLLAVLATCAGVLPAAGRVTRRRLAAASTVQSTAGRARLNWPTGSRAYA